MSKAFTYLEVQFEITVRWWQWASVEDCEDKLIRSFTSYSFALKPLTRTEEKIPGKHWKILVWLFFCTELWNVLMSLVCLQTEWPFLILLCGWQNQFSLLSYIYSIIHTGSKISTQRHSCSQALLVELSFRELECDCWGVVFLWNIQIIYRKLLWYIQQKWMI